MNPAAPTPWEEPKTSAFHHNYLPVLLLAPLEACLGLAEVAEGDKDVTHGEVAVDHVHRLGVADRVMQLAQTNRTKPQR